MIAHIALFTWEVGTDPADVAGLADALEAMAASLPSVRHYRCGPNLHLRDGGADFAVVALVEDQAGLDAYLDSPEHVQVVGERVKPHLATRQAVQIELGDDWLAAAAALGGR